MAEIRAQIEAIVSSDAQRPRGSSSSIKSTEALQVRLAASLVDDFQAAARSLRSHMGQINALREMHVRSLPGASPR